MVPSGAAGSASEAPLLLWWFWQAALAQTARTAVDAHGIVFVPQNGELIEPLATYRPTRPCTHKAAADVFLERAERPLVLGWRQEDGTVEHEVWLDDVWAANLGILGACHPNLNVGATWPIYLKYTTELGDRPAAFGDPRVSVHLTKATSGGAGARPIVRWGAVLFSDLPLGPPAGHLGRYRVSAGAVAMASYDARDWSFAGNLGGQVLPRTRVADVRGGPQLIASLAADRRVSARIGAGIEVQAHGILLDTPVLASRAPSELLAHARLRAGNAPWVTLGAGLGLTPGQGAADWRLFLGVGLGDRRVDLAGDPDWDGFAGDADACPADAEILNGLRDGDGCPDALADVTIRVIDAVTREPIAASIVAFDGLQAQGPDALFPARMPDRALRVGISAFGYADWSGEITIVEGPQTREVALQPLGP